ncbi:hypothetical protein ACFV6F_23880 [Kitasatospora phosalacinea]|uniref:hypothetical protein n=1 Tax=Kitasatospora phosalacinea TaxID=2065 RepID=UPI00365FF918
METRSAAEVKEFRQVAARAVRDFALRTVPERYEAAARAAAASINRLFTWTPAHRATVSALTADTCTDLTLKIQEAIRAATAFHRAARVAAGRGLTLTGVAELAAAHPKETHRSEAMGFPGGTHRAAAGPMATLSGMPKKPESPRAEELAAEIVVNQVLGTATLARDDNSADGMIDALLAGPGQARPTTALEVTSNLHEEQAELWGALHKHYSEKRFPKLGAGWLVEFTGASRIGGQQQKTLLAFLTDLEARGVTRVSTRDEEQPAVARDDVDVLRALRLRVVAQVGTEPDVRGRIFASTSAVGSAGDVTTYLDAFLLGEVAANKLRKLQRAKDEGLRTLLFVWADTSHMTVGVALDRAHRPTGQPAVPAHLDEVWLASYFAPDTVFRWSREADWEVIAVPRGIARAAVSAECLH